MEGVTNMTEVKVPADVESVILTQVVNMSDCECSELSRFMLLLTFCKFMFETRTLPSVQSSSWGLDFFSY